MKIFRFAGLTFFSLFLFIHPLFSGISETDTIRVLALRVQFQPDNSDKTTGDGTFDLSVVNDPYMVDPPPHNRAYFQDHLLFLKNYFARISRGNLQIESEVFPLANSAAYQLDNPMTFYNPNTTPQANNAGLALLVRDALQKADADTAVNFSGFQSVIIFHAGVGKDIDLGFDETPQDIPSLFITSHFLQENLGQPSVIVDGGIAISNAMLLPETESQEGLQLGLNGILVSNFGSQLGWMDLFSPVTRRSGIGRFGLMDAGLFNGDGLLPAIPCAWTRIDAGWETPIDIYSTPTQPLPVYSPLSQHPERVYRFPINSQEYFLVENRFAGKQRLDSLRYEMGQGQAELITVKEVLLTHFADQVTFSPRGVLTDVKNPDLGLPGSGCLIWHIDEKVIAANRAQNRINADPDHRGVDLEEADGSQDIGQEFDFLSAGSGSENGWLLDMWYSANNAPVFQRNGNRFSPNTIPDSRSYYNRANSHISLSNFSAADSVMTFSAKMDIFQQNFPRQIDPGNYGKITSLKTADLDFDGSGELLLTTTTGQVLALDKSGRSAWGADSLLLTDLGGTIVDPPVIFRFSRSGLAQIGLVALMESGRVEGLLFKAPGQVDSLFSTYQTGQPVSTPPVARQISDDAAQIYWGTRSGRIFRLDIEGSELPYDTVSYSIGEPVKFIQLASGGEVLAVGASGMLYVDGQPQSGAGTVTAAPAGNQNAAPLSGGGFVHTGHADLTFESTPGPAILSPLTTLEQDSPGAERLIYFATADNRILSFNYNFTLSENFPRQVYQPEQTATLSLSPLINRFFTSGMTEDYGVLVTDPAGLIDGVDLTGDRLPDFPLALGDSVTVTPVLLDIDDDSDVELAAVTVSGRLTVWDLASTHAPETWNQQYADALNSNRNLVPAAQPSNLRPSRPALSGLLPAEKVYNWPNPNIGNFTFIRYYLTAPAEVSIKIFDLAGDLVTEMRGPGQALTDNEIRWDLDDVQSGVYFARVQASEAGRKETRIIKVAVVK